MQTQTAKLPDTSTASERAAGVLSPQRAAEFYSTYGFRVRTNSDICHVLERIGIAETLNAEHEPEPAQPKGRQK